MTHETETSAADIAWMRRLAEEGATAPMRGASILMAAGLLYGLASLFHWALLVGVAPLSVDSTWIGWVGATLAFWALLAVAIPRLKRAEGAYTTANKASGIAWSGMGWGIFALFVSMAVLGWRMGADATPTLFVLIPSVILVFYGVGWAVSGAMFKSQTMWTLSIASFAAAPALAALAGTSALYLAYAAALFGLMALPGYLFMRAANRA
jgi:hypothetical protein